MEVSMSFAILLCAPAYSQTINVASFVLRETDLTANLKETTVWDQNGDRLTAEGRLAAVFEEHAHPRAGKGEGPARCKFCEAGRGRLWEGTK